MRSRVARLMLILVPLLAAPVWAQEESVPEGVSPTAAAPAEPKPPATAPPPPPIPGPKASAPQRSSGNAQAPPPVPPDQTAGSGGLPPHKRRQIRVIEQKINAASHFIEQLRKELRQVQLQPDTPPPTPVPAPPPPQRAAPPPPQGRTAPPPPPIPAPQRTATTVADEEEDEEEDELEQEEVAGDQELPEFTPGFLRAARAVLIPKGLLETNFGIAYSHTDRNQIAVRGLDIVDAVFVGTFEIRKVRQDSLGLSVGLRYGIHERLQFNTTIPYRFAYSSRFRPPGTITIGTGDGDANETNNKNSGFGDIELGFSTHLLRENRFFPDTIATFGLKTTSGVSPFDTQEGESATGTGFWGMRGGLTIVKVTDPASVFANAGYFYHIPEHKNGLKFDPADSVDAGMGFAISLNPFFSVNFAGTIRYTTKLKIDGERISGTEQWDGRLSVGATYGFARARSMDVAMTFGLTEDAPDFAIRMGMPVRWNLNPLINRIKVSNALAAITRPFQRKKTSGKSVDITAEEQDEE